MDTVKSGIRTCAGMIQQRKQKRSHNSSQKWQGVVIEGHENLVTISVIKDKLGPEGMQW